MLKSLLELANDLIFSIADFLSEGSVDALARTNRRLYLLLNDHLYKYNAIHMESSALWWGVRNRQSGSVAKSIAQGGNVNVQWDGFLKYSQYGLHGSRSNTSVVSETRVLSRNQCLYCTPIYYAVLGGNDNIVELLIQNGADIDSSLGPWANPLQVAIQYDRVLAARQLAAQGNDIDKPAPDTGRTALHIACLEGNDVIVRHLIELGANVMARDIELDTPLHLTMRKRGTSWSCEHSVGHLRAVQWLLISGADMHARNRQGESPVSRAIKIKVMDFTCLFKIGGRISVHEAGFRGIRLSSDSTSLQRLWTAYVDKQTEATAEVLRKKKAQAESIVREESAKQKQQFQQAREFKRRDAENQKQVKGSMRK